MVYSSTETDFHVSTDEGDSTESSRDNRHAVLKASGVDDTGVFTYSWAFESPTRNGRLGTYHWAT